MKFLVIGGTGTVGRNVVRGLLERGHSARVLTRSESKARSLPAGAEGAVGDVADPSSLRRPLEGIDGVFLAIPVDPEETRLGLNAVEAIRAAGVGRLVYLSVFHADAAPEVPHFASKPPIERAMGESGIPHTVLRPNYFFQNDGALAEAIANGVYPQPVGSVGINAVDVGDIADVAVQALTESGHQNHVYPLVGPDALTGESIAAGYSRHLGRTVRYGGDDLDAWAKRIETFAPEWMIQDLRLMFRHFQRQGMRASEADLALVRQALGREPRRFESFAAELAESIRRDRKEG